MALFREHIAAGALVSMAVTTAVHFYALLTDPVLLVLLFVVTIVGSFLPDVDSDSGLPFYLVYGTISVIATGIVLLYVLQNPPDSLYVQIGIPIGALLFFWIVVGGLLKKCTHHRGIFHSLPAAMIAGLLTFLVAMDFDIGESGALVLGVGMTLGFLSHLILDELHAGVNLDGIPFIPKKSLGTALKLFSNSKGVNLLTYTLLAALIYTSLP